MMRLRWCLLRLGLFGGSILLCLAASASSATGQQASDSVSMILPDEDGMRYWSRWRGPSGHGLVDGTAYPDTWSDTDHVLWKVNVPGRGNSSPIVWDDRIFLTTARERGKRISILSFRRSDWELLWETFVPTDRPEHTHQKNTHASATPTTDGERVYASFGSQGLVAVDFDGRLIWQTKLGRIDNYHGTAGSPLLYKDRIIIYQDQRRGSFIAALDKHTGDTIWRTGRSATVGWGTPIAIRAGDHDEIIVSSQRGVYAYDPDSGKEL